MTTPILRVRPVARLAALEEGTYPISWATRVTRSRVAAATYPCPVRARLAVAFETPAARATSSMPLTSLYLPAVLCGSRHRTRDRSSISCRDRLNDERRKGEPVPGECSVVDHYADSEKSAPRRSYRLVMVHLLCAGEEGDTVSWKRFRRGSYEGTMSALNEEESFIWA